MAMSEFEKAMLAETKRHNEEVEHHLAKLTYLDRIAHNVCAIANGETGTGGPSKLISAVEGLDDAIRNLPWPL